MSYETLTFTIENGVGIVRLNRPQALNALVSQMARELLAVVDAVEEPGGGARCLLLTGEGRAFCSGVDLAKGLDVEITPETLKALDAGAVLEKYYNPLFLRLRNLPMPIVSAVNGVAAGAGCSLALAGDIVLAARSAYFLQAFVNIGLVPDVGATYMLPRLVGKARAQAMMMLGERLPAETAADWGMIYKVTDDSALMDEAMTVAQRLANGPTRSLAMIRDMTLAALDNALPDQLQMERECQFKAGRTADFLEGVEAFMTKRPARFTGN